MTQKLYHKNFIILVLGQIISLFGNAIQRFALSLYLLDLTGSAAIFATILALSMIPVVVLAPIAGMLADRGNKKKAMVFLDLLSGSLLLLYVTVGLHCDEQTLVITILMILLSAIATIYQPVVNTSIPLIIPKEELVRANAIIQQVASLSNFLGPILAGVLYGVLGIRGVVIFNLISFFFSAGMELLLQIPHKKVTRNSSFRQAFLMDMKVSYQFLRYENPIVFRMLLFSGFYNLFLVPVFSVVAPYLIKITFGLSSEVYGIVEGGIALGMILGGALIGWKPRQFHIKRVHRLLYLTALAMFLMAGTLFGFGTDLLNALQSTIVFTGAGMLIMGVLGVANVLTAAYLYQAVAVEKLGKVLAFGSAFATCCIPLGQLLFGNLLELFRERLWSLLLFAGVAVFVVTLLVRWNVRQIPEE
ncbi:MFS transporter [Anaerosporobacter faecicola]|uniref:MFS transporter n=1 Tax=Anaerosporobacter faecicola TaxID=2718714 RepID=UPI001439C27E|nr:MFS transporter [Anaerosporobacter faecicola]